jgi:hypothetical protein
MQEREDNVARVRRPPVIATVKAPTEEKPDPHVRARIVGQLNGNYRVTFQCPYCTGIHKHGVVRAHCHRKAPCGEANGRGYFINTVDWQLKGEVPVDDGKIVQEAPGAPPVTPEMIVATDPAAAHAAAFAGG